MKKETVLTAVVFFVLGCLAGYIYDAQKNWNARQKVASVPQPTDGGTPGAPAGGAMPPGLPEGHPPIDSAVIVKQLEDLAAQNPKDPEVRLKLANFLYDQRQYAQAIEWYQRTLELDPKNVNARTDLGTAYFYTGRPREALREYRKSLALNPRHEPTLLNMVVVNLEGTHDLAAAQAAWDRLHKVNPNSPALESLRQKLDAARGAPR
jgi:tetratricopeptide (TPR) repeat protein